MKNFRSMDRERVLSGQTVVVRDGKIVSVGPASSASIPADATRIDGRGKYLMPGLAEMHAHVAGAQAAGNEQTNRDIFFLCPGFFSAAGNRSDGRFRSHAVSGSGEWNAECREVRVGGSQARRWVRYGDAGNRADLVLLDANPLEDIRNLTRRSGVMVQGWWVPKSEIDAGLEEMARRNAGR